VIHLTDYIVFFGLVISGLVFYILIIRLEKTYPVTVDQERQKCESPIELRLYDALTINGYYVKTQVPCGKYRIDLALPTYKIAIECDGHQYHSTPEQKAHDRRKNAYLRQQGWKVLRFSGRAIHWNLPKILAKIQKCVDG
jgi:very-short-patch-repair endonuclease